MIEIIRLIKRSVLLLNGLIKQVAYLIQRE